MGRGRDVKASLETLDRLFVALSLLPVDSAFSEGLKGPGPTLPGMVN